ncbi:latrophilin-like protein LAT-2 isoform X2 [Dysidea avara]|uniref:latrophilin-like protein LAT-2 isoform X2 n=1 Tax=Dysidea avara TaxID=196820 RepID=UPI00332524AE
MIHEDDETFDITITLMTTCLSISVDDNSTTVTILNHGAHPLVVTISPLNITADRGKQVTFSCSATGIAANSFTYGWLLNGVPVSGEESSSLVATASEDNTGDYQCTVRNKYGGFNQSSVATLILNQFCYPVTVNYTGFNVTWNETLVGVTVETPCTGPGLNGTVLRRCKGEDDWKEIVKCFRVTFKELLDEVKNISTLNETEKIDAATGVVMAISNLTTPEDDVFAEDIDLAVRVLDTVTDITRTVVTKLKPNDTLFEETASVINNLLDNSNQDKWTQLRQTSPEASQSLVNSTEQFGTLLGGTLNDETPEAIIIRSNVVIKASLISNYSVQAGKDYVFPREIDDLSNFTGGNTKFTFPNDALKGVLKQLPNYTMGFPITSTILRGDVIQLPNPSNENETFLPISPIVSIQAPVPVNTSENNAIMVSFPVKDDSQISESLELSHNLPTTLQTLASRQLRTKSCQFYDHNLLDLQLNQAGGWSQEGLRLDNSSTDTRITCLTTHLTSFAVLVSVRGTKPTPADDALSIISYIGCAISLVCLCLSIVILTYVLFRTKDKKNNVFIHLNVCIALALGLIVFVSGIETATEYRTSCIIVAVLLQYFFISAFCWMLCEGVILYMMLVTVFDNKLNRRRFFFILGWGPAIPIVAISAGIVHRYYGTDDYCWIKSEDGAIAAFIAPIGAMILINCVFLGITLKVLYQNTRNAIRERASINKATTKDLLKATVVLLPLLGLTWIIGVLAVNNDTVAFAWIFAILNSLQGVFIFIFHVVKNNQVAKVFRDRNNFWKGSKLYNFYSRIRSDRKNTSTITSTMKTRTVQSDVSLRGKKISTTSVGSSSSGGEYLSTTRERRRPSKEVPEIALEDNVSTDEPVKLKTFKRLEESIIEEQDAGSEKGTNLNDDETEVNESTPERHEIKEESTFKVDMKVDDDAASIKDEDVENMENQSSTLAKIKPAVLPHTKK